MGRYDSRQKRAILEAAVNVFAERGLEGATIRLVGREAGSNSALIYYYFENKRKLFEEVIRMVFNDFLAALAGQSAPLENARARINFLVNGIFDYYESRRTRMRLMMQVFNLHADLLTKAVVELLRQREVLPLKVLKDGIALGEFRPFSPLPFWWSLLGMCIFNIQAEEIAVKLGRKKIYPGLPALPERKRQIAELILSGLAVSKAGRCGTHRMMDATPRASPETVIPRRERVPPRQMSRHGTVS